MIIPAEKNSIIQNITSAIRKVSSGDIYLYGDTVSESFDAQYISANISLCVVSSVLVSINDLYPELIKKITVNQELVNTTNLYQVTSNNYIIELTFAADLNEWNNIVNPVFSSDQVLINIETQALTGLNNTAVQCFHNKVLKFNSIDFNLHNLMLLAARLTMLPTWSIDSNQFDLLKNLKLSDFHSTADDIILLLSAYRPGKAIKNITEWFSNGITWLFEQFILLANHNNISLSEDISSDKILSHKKFDLLDTYNEFFLLGKKTPETRNEVISRIHQNLQIILDTHNFNFQPPFIEKISFFSNFADNITNIQVETFATPDCPYGNCDECKPEECHPQCCCCHSMDIVSATQLHCHKQIVLSCNRDGTGYGSGPTEIFNDCPDCVTACQTVLGLRPDLEGENCTNFTNIGQSEGWWNIPSSLWPCECRCAKTNGDECDLTCVTCANIFCKSVANITGNDCNYNISLTPSSECCGVSHAIDCVFVADWGAPNSNICESDIRQGVIRAATTISDQFSTARFGLVIIDENNPDSDAYGLRYAIAPTDINTFLSNIPDRTYPQTASDRSVPLAHGTYYAAVNTQWRNDHRYIIALTANNTRYYPAGACGGITNNNDGQCLDNLLVTFNFLSVIFGTITCNDVNSIDFVLESLIQHTNGMSMFFEPFIGGGQIENTLTQRFNEIAFFPSSCDCLDTTHIFIRRNTPECQCCQDNITDPCVDDPTNTECINNLPSWCFDIPIKKCFPGEVCDCTLPYTFNVCGNTVVIAPEVSTLACCSEVGFGCDCEVVTQPIECCGPQCFDICSLYQQNQDVDEIINFVWEDCWSKKAAIDLTLTPNCTDPCCPDAANPNDNNYPCELREQTSTQPCCPCSLSNQNDCCNCCIKFLDETGQPTITYCRGDVSQQVRNAISDCVRTPPPPPPWDPPDQECHNDICIVGDPELTEDRDLQNQCDRIYLGCTPVKNPSTVVLNNGIGLVAYEYGPSPTTIRIQQFKTSVKNKILPNRDFNYGRLQNRSKWINGTAKLYTYDDVSVNLLTGSTSNTDNVKDIITFKNGPLEKQFFALADPAYGQDDTGNYLLFFVSPDISLSHQFPSSDDVYNIQFFILDNEDTGLIGDATDTSSIGDEFDIRNHRIIDQLLFLTPHIYNGEIVPISHPSLCTATNYSNALENSHYVYLTYQALENNAWKIYLRQVRLSEFEREEQISDAIAENDLISLLDLNINEVLYRVVCSSDACTATDENQFILSRLVIFEVILDDYREVLNPDLTGNWGSLCPGHSSSEFPKQKVFIQLVQSAIGDRCPDYDIFDKIFTNWSAGQTYNVPTNEISAFQLFQLVQSSNDIHINIGTFNPPISINDVNIYSSSVTATWYRNSNETTWSVLNTDSFETLSTYKGIDISEPILVGHSNGHCTRPVIRTNSNNDVFIAFEDTETGQHQIRIIGTTTPSTNLPVGILNPKNPDQSLNYFLKTNDFTYSDTITLDGLNQKPDLFIDREDQLHIAWHSNRDQEWEIYYAKSGSNFTNERITKFAGRSLNPSITGDSSGRIFIVWHDNRFNNYEIMLAYNNNETIDPLSQQDPYLASLRNNYTHYVNTFPFIIQNTSGSVMCFNNIIVDFFKDRTLDQLLLSIDANTFPMSFSIPNAKNDATTQTFIDFTNWADSDPYTGQDLITGPEFDTFLVNSVITSIQTIFTVTDNITPSVQISFRASNFSNDENSSSQWTEWVTLPESGLYIFNDLDIGTVSGRYKQTRFKLSYESIPPEINQLIIISESMNRICLTSGDSVTVAFNVSVPLRIDPQGDITENSPIPFAFSKNQTYFIRIRAVNEDNAIIVMPDNKISISCSECSGVQSVWNYESCSIKYDIHNTTNEIQYYNLRFSFYTDSERRNRIAAYNAFPNNNDLSQFSVNDNQKAQDIWEPQGLKIDPDAYATVIFWPNLSLTTGLLCNIDYYVSIEICQSSISDAATCTENDLEISKILKWICNYQSNRWNINVEEAPQSFLTLQKWNSSAYGRSDTRITYTTNETNNLNPIIRIRSNQNGVIVYESNRIWSSDTEKQLNRYRIFSSVFSVIPQPDMYATGSQSIISPFNSFICRSDIPICKDKGCFDNNGQQINDILIGQNSDFSLDQYDNIFLATESALPSVDNPSCNEFVKNQQKYITIHTCGANATDLFTNDITLNTLQCQKENVLQNIFSDQQYFADKLVRQIRVKNEFVDYHITYQNVPMPVVKTCKIAFEIVGTIESKSIRLRNSSHEWSEWFSLNPETQPNGTDISWTLTSESGLKTVEFQVETSAGITATNQITVLADYDKIKFNLNLYRSPQNLNFPPDTIDLTNKELWTANQLVHTYNSLSAATMRGVYIDNETIIVPTSDYLLVEIIPSAEYLEQFQSITDADKLSGASGIEPTFDLLQQGSQDIYGIKTIWARAENGSEVFRGTVNINRANQSGYRDGLSYIVPHFKNDCASKEAIGGSILSFSKDIYNVFGKSTISSQNSEDIWKNQRDINGQIKYQIQIRPQEDPYFIFGDPDYRLNN